MKRSFVKMLSALLTAGILLTLPFAFMEENVEIGSTADVAMEQEGVENPALDLPVEEISFELGEGPTADAVSQETPAEDEAIDTSEVAPMVAEMALEDGALYDGSEDEDIEVPIDAAHFPDKNFREYIQETCDYDKDGCLSEYELNRREIDVYDMHITSLKGIEYFQSLKRLSCGSNYLSELDVSSNTELREIVCYYNQLTRLDVANNPELTQL